MSYTNKAVSALTLLGAGSLVYNGLLYYFKIPTIEDFQGRLSTEDPSKVAYECLKKEVCAINLNDPANLNEGHLADKNHKLAVVLAKMVKSGVNLDTPYGDDVGLNIAKNLCGWATLKRDADTENQFESQPFTQAMLKREISEIVANSESSAISSGAYDSTSHSTSGTSGTTTEGYHHVPTEYYSYHSNPNYKPSSSLYQPLTGDSTSSSTSSSTSTTGDESLHHIFCFGNVAYLWECLVNATLGTDDSYHSGL